MQFLSFHDKHTKYNVHICNESIVRKIASPVPPPHTSAANMPAPTAPATNATSRAAANVGVAALDELELDDALLLEDDKLLERLLRTLEERLCTLDDSEEASLLATLESDEATLEAPLELDEVMLEAPLDALLMALLRTEEPTLEREEPMLEREEPTWRAATGFVGVARGVIAGSGSAFAHAARTVVKMTSGIARTIFGG
ncbi:hypothetical protein BC834DRAFT_884236 [Gloeopeniophorella convolvens]|nr:hypothetical protein BC834DRAFT_884236 [Gloeopeniophorella convolvens]